MSQQQDNFSGGFVLGAIVGGVVGGILGVVLATPKAATTPESNVANADELKVAKPRRRPLRGMTEPMTEPMTEQSMEAARQGLESKIAQLNDAIDDVRQQISSVNGRSESSAEKFPS
jgi:esterase/lipase